MYYVASRTRHANMWRLVRETLPINASWIDEAEAGQTQSLPELWRRIESEVKAAHGLIFYAEKDDFPLKGALIEAGIALAAGKPVALLIPEVELESRSYRPVGSWMTHPLCRRVPSLTDAREYIDAFSREHAGQAQSPLSEIRDAMETFRRACGDSHVFSLSWDGITMRAIARQIGTVALQQATFDPEDFAKSVPGLAMEVARGYALAPQAPTERRLTLDTDKQVFFYEQDHYYLSNFSAFAIHYDRLCFPTAEHLYHWHKFAGLSSMRQEIQSRIFLARSAHDAFKIAQEEKAKRIPEWDDIKIGVMRDILRLKVMQHEYVRRKLLETGDREIIENSWRDDYWGWGPNRDGANMLGKLWMEVRAEQRP